MNPTLRQVIQRWCSKSARTVITLRRRAHGRATILWVALAPVEQSSEGECWPKDSALARLRNLLDGSHCHGTDAFADTERRTRRHRTLSTVRPMQSLVLQGVSLRLAQGESVGIVGRRPRQVHARAMRTGLWKPTDGIVDSMAPICRLAAETLGRPWLVRRTRTVQGRVAEILSGSKGRFGAGRTRCATRACAG